MNNHVTPVLIFQISFLCTEFSIIKTLFLHRITLPVKIQCVRLIEICITSLAEPPTKHPVSLLTSTVKEKLRQTVGSMLKLPSMNKLLTLTLKLRNIVFNSTIHLSYLKVTNYFTEITCLGLQMKTHTESFFIQQTD